MVSAQGEAVHWQMRINYYHYKKVKKQCQAQPKCEVGRRAAQSSVCI